MTDSTISGQNQSNKDDSADKITTDTTPKKKRCIELDTSSSSTHYISYQFLYLSNSKFQLQVKRKILENVQKS